MSRFPSPEEFEGRQAWRDLRHGVYNRQKNLLSTGDALSEEVQLLNDAGDKFILRVPYAIKKFDEEKSIKLREGEYFINFTGMVIKNNKTYTELSGDPVRSEPSSRNVRFR